MYHEAPTIEPVPHLEQHKGGIDLVNDSMSGVIGKNILGSIGIEHFLPEAKK